MAKGNADYEYRLQPVLLEERNAAFQKDIVQIDNSLSDLPAYSGMYGAD